MRLRGRARRVLLHLAYMQVGVGLLSYLAMFAYPELPFASLALPAVPAGTDHILVRPAVARGSDHAASRRSHGGGVPASRPLGRRRSAEGAIRCCCPSTSFVVLLFRDHYLGVEYDLSRVLFIATANLLEPIQPAFRDRMEVIRLSGYTEHEKLVIARRHLIPKQLEENGVTEEHVTVEDGALIEIISRYTKEAGLRNLERELASIFRKVAVRVARGGEGAEGGAAGGRRGGGRELLGPARHFPEELLGRDRVGVATGLAWTAAGGDLMFIEAVAVEGEGRLRLTGQLGDVMKESGQAALSFARAWAETSDKAPPDRRRFFSSHDIHIHVPAGSVPKDGPSAGITIATALLSVLTGRPVNRGVAMTGEITLRGDVLPIGGLKEKVLAARGAGVRGGRHAAAQRARPRGDPRALKEGVTFHLVDSVDEVLGWPCSIRAPEDPGRRAHPGTRRRPRQRAKGGPRMSAAADRGEDRLLDWLRSQPGTELLGDDAALLAGATARRLGRDHGPTDRRGPRAGGPGRRSSSPGASSTSTCRTSRRAVRDRPTPWSRWRPPKASATGASSRPAREGCREEEVRLAGGDLASSPTLALTMTLLGHRRTEDWRLGRAGGRRPGDALWVGGTVGDSGAGQRLLRRGARLAAHSEHAHVFLPGELRARTSRGRSGPARGAGATWNRRAQLALGLWLGGARPARRGLDLSDGLARDLPRLARGERRRRGGGQRGAAARGGVRGAVRRARAGPARPGAGRRRGLRAPLRPAGGRRAAGALRLHAIGEIDEGTT